jgi:hypothetical protein
MFRLLNLLIACLLVAVVLFSAVPAHAQYSAFQSVTQFITVQNIDGSFSQVPVTTLVQSQPLAIYNNYSPFGAFTSVGYPAVVTNRFAYSTAFPAFGFDVPFRNRAFVNTGFFVRPRAAFVGPRFAFGPGFRAGFVTARGRVVNTNRPVAFRAARRFR